MSTETEDITQHDPEHPLSRVPLPSPGTAYVKSEGHFWNEKQLHPFDVMRVSAAYAMGLRYGRWTADDLKTWGESGAYSQLPNDIVIVLFLCSLPKVARPVKIGEGDDARYETPLTVPKVFSNPDAAIIAAYEWAERENVDFSGDGIGKAADEFLNIMREIDASKFKVLPKEEKGASVTVIHSSSDDFPNA